ncbi:cytochrome P450 [Aspergillus udagawae]|uniref:Cytochrome P450 n=1 Tax=Aspergillus udagawae TaxID=91492 RepID=A0A8H3S9I5_9EURO|nr:cytochrome P450 [Aspergillus udagawae]
MSTYIILRDSKIIPEPLAFRPERWTQQGGESLNRYPMPFSRGSQACLGPRYELSLYDTTEKNVEIVRDCFNGQTRPGYNCIQVKVVRELQ